MAITQLDLFSRREDKTGGLVGAGEAKELPDLLTQTKVWIADRLRESGEFAVVDIDHKFNNRLLDAQRKRNLYAEKRILDPADRTNKFLIVVSTEPLNPTSLLEEKSEESYRQGIAIMYVQHKKSPTLEHTVERPDYYFFRWDGGLNNEARRHISLLERKRHMQTTVHERKLDKLTSRTVVYFNPHGKLEVIEFKGGITPNYEYVEERLGKKLRGKCLTGGAYKTIMDHTVTGAYPFFTLRRAPGSKLLQAEPATYNNLSRAASLLAWEASLVRIGEKREDLHYLEDRIPQTLDGCGVEELMRLTRMFGKEALGEYAR